MGSRATRRRVTIVAGVLLVVEVVVVGRRRGSWIAPRTVVRCRSGHLFTTLWIPGASAKAVRLGWWRFQRCPVGRHWSLVTPVKVAELTGAQRRAAAAFTDLPIP